MTGKQIRDVYRKAPFVPFTIRMADGSALHVPHPDYMSISPEDRTVIVYAKRGGFSILDALLITEIELNPPTAASA